MSVETTWSVSARVWGSSQSLESSSSLLLDWTSFLSMPSTKSGSNPARKCRFCTETTSSKAGWGGLRKTRSSIRCTFHSKFHHLMCVCMYVFMYICLPVCINVCMCGCACTCVFIYVCMHACMYVSYILYVCINVCMCMYVGTCMYVWDLNCQ